MITVSIPQDRGIFLKIPVLAGKIKERVLAAVQKDAIELQRYVVRNKLSGQVLNKITGHLQQSIQQEVTQTESSVTGKVYSDGSVKYAGIHEYGGVIPAHTIEAINGKALAFMWRGEQVFFKSVTIPDVHMPERSFLRSSLRDNREKITNDIREAAVIAIKE